jgi:hypothetical protein
MILLFPVRSRVRRFDAICSERLFLETHLVQL